MFKETLRGNQTSQLLSCLQTPGREATFSLSQHRAPAGMQAGLEQAVLQPTVLPGNPVIPCADSF